MIQYIKNISKRIKEKLFKPRTPNGGFLIRGKYCYTESEVINAIKEANDKFNYPYSKEQEELFKTKSNYSEQLKSKQETRSSNTNKWESTIVEYTIRPNEFELLRKQAERVKEIATTNKYPEHSLEAVINVSNEVLELIDNISHSSRLVHRGHPGPELVNLPNSAMPVNLSGANYVFDKQKTVDVEQKSIKTNTTVSKELLNMLEQNKNNEPFTSLKHKPKKGNK